MRHLPHILKSLLAAGLMLIPMAAFAAPTAAMKTAWLGEYEAFPAWYAKSQGWDKEAGLEIEMLRFESGKALIEGMKPYKWVIGGCGAVPTVSTAVNDACTIIGVAGDESPANAIFVREKSPVLSVKGSNPEFPGIFGDAATVKGKKVLCPRGTSAHYTLANWLKAFGLSERDVHIQSMDPTQAQGAFKAGVGDILVTWAPYTYAAQAAGFKAAAVASDCRIELPLVLLADKSFLAERAEDVKRFLAIYQRGAEFISGDITNDKVEAYIRFSREWNKRELGAEEARADLASHMMHSLDEQALLMGKDIDLFKRILEKIALFHNMEKGAVRIPSIDGSFLPR